MLCRPAECFAVTVMEEDQWKPAGVNFYQENDVPSLEPGPYLGSEQITVRIQVQTRIMAARACAWTWHGCSGRMDAAVVVLRR